MLTIGHHTCSNINTSQVQVIADSPYESEHAPQNDLPKFLGSGYYFWDYNKDYAKYWGKSHYRGNFYIIECELDLKKPYFLDLVGRRQDLEWFVKQYKILKEEGFDIGEFNVGTVIETLKEWRDEENNPDIFPFTAIRAVNSSVKLKEQILVAFVENRDDAINLNPRMFICLTEKNNILLRSKKIIYDSGRGK